MILSISSFVVNSFWVGTGALVTRFSSFLVLPFLARLLGPTELGLYNLIQATIQAADGLANVGADVSIHRNGAQYGVSKPEALGRLFGVGACLIISSGLIIATLLWITKRQIATQWLGDSRVELWLTWASIIVFIQIAGNPAWLYMLALKAFREFAIRQSVIAISSIILSCTLTLFFGLSGAIISLLVIALINLIIGWYLALLILRKNNIFLRINNFLHESLTIFKLGFPFYFSNAFNYFISLPLLGYVGQTSGFDQLGYLRVAQSLSQFITFLPTVIAPVIISELSINLIEDPIIYRRNKSFHLRTLWFILLLVTLLISISLEHLIPLLFGLKYSNAIPLSRLTIWIAAITSLYGIFNQYLVCIGNTIIISSIQIFGAFINLVLAIVLIPNLGSMGFLIAQFLSVVIIAFLYLKPSLDDIKDDNKKILYLSLLTMAFMLCTFGIPFIFKDRWINTIIFSFIFIFTSINSYQFLFLEDERSYIYLKLSQYFKLSQLP